MPTKKQSSLDSVPWMSGPNLSLDNSILKVTQAVTKHMTGEGKLSLPAKDERILAKQFGHAAQGRSNTQKFMIALAREMNLAPHEAVRIAPMKEWARAVGKLNAHDRKLNDLGRGRILIESTNAVVTFNKLMNGKGTLENVYKGAKVIPDSLDNYLVTRRSSGYAGSINFDVEVELNGSSVIIVGKSPSFLQLR